MKGNSGSKDKNIKPQIFTKFSVQKLRLPVYNSAVILFFLCYLFVIPPLYAQEIPEEQAIAEEDMLYDDEEQTVVNEPVEDRMLSQERRLLELEIRSSSLTELAIWSRSLGLSEGGTRADLSRRLRTHFNLSEPVDNEDDNQRIITIDSAKTTEYFTIDVIDEDYARLLGEVRLSLVDRNTVHRIRANDILFNRTRNILTARGQVEYIREEGDKTEIFRGEKITVNIDDWSSIFLDGVSERTLSNEGTTYRFAGTVITRNDEDVMMLRNAQISNAQNEEALWSISASRLWLLPGSDFAILNAVLKVGEIPVLYIPAFYFPADEIIFHPVIGYRSREGAFVQTTTYILGRPKADSADQSSIARILGNSNDMEKERHGIFLRSTGRRVQDPNTTTLKAMIDYYTNLGAHIGLELSTPRTGILNPLDLSLGIGFTRTITTIDGNYSPYAPNFDGTFDWNYSNLFSRAVPFRYRFRTQSSISSRLGGFSWNIPFYSDPYVDRDFLNRSESMDWMNMIQQGAALDDTAAAQSELGAYQWQLTGNLRPSLPFLAPYVSSVAISNLSTTLAFRTLRDDEIFQNNRDHPGRFFFAPDRYTIYSISGSISGTPLSIGGTNQPSANVNASRQMPEDPLRGIGRPISPWVTEEDETEGGSNARGTPDDKLIPPVINQRFELPRTGNARFSIDYSLSPTGSSELQFMSGFNRWQSFDMVDWNDVQSILTSIRGNAGINLRLDHTSNIYSNVVTFSGSGTWNEFNYINEEAEAFRTPQNSDGDKDPARVEAARRQQFSQTNYATSYAYNGTLRPFHNNPLFSQTNLQYAFRGTLVRSKRYTDGDGPELTPIWGKWVKEEIRDGVEIPGLNSHRLSANLAANIMDRLQNITLSADLPPFDGLISANSTFRVWISETNARIEFRRPEMIDNEPNSEWKTQPFHLTQTLRFPDVGSLTYYMVMNPEDDNEITTITSSLTLWRFRASFSAVKLIPFEFEPNNPDNMTLGGRWVQVGEPALNPRDLSLSYNQTFSNVQIIKDRLNFSLNVNSSLSYDLQRYTNSNFQFTMGFSLGIPGFLDLTLSATSENAVIFRYFKGIPGMEGLTAMYIDGPQNNLFIDLFDSFNFFDDSKRRRSGFKMKRFNLAATHHLGDWRATLNIAMSPFLNNTASPPRYELNADISFLVQWSAITEIKSDIKYEKRTERWSIQ
jgi:hypothetical protein